jgi:hypothetical protein
MNTNADLRIELKLQGPQSYINGEINRPWMAEQVLETKIYYSN